MSQAAPATRLSESIGVEFTAGVVAGFAELGGFPVRRILHASYLSGTQELGAAKQPTSTV